MAEQRHVDGRTLQLLRSQVKKGQDLLRQFDSGGYEIWKNTTTRRLSEALGDSESLTALLRGWERLRTRPHTSVEQDLAAQIRELEDVIEELEAPPPVSVVGHAALSPAPVGTAPPPPPPALTAPPTPPALGEHSRETLMPWSPLPAASPGRLPPSAAATSLNAVFLVHGHDKEALHETARFLEKLVAKVIILHEQANEGRTIIEKFTSYSNVDYAVVLLTPDDRGGPITAPYEEQRPRARQNVILELGFFLGKLGGGRVCALHRGNIELPSDYQGVLFVAFDDSGAWRQTLAREMKAAGLPIDFNKLVG